jgi:hypothetical protein
MDKYMSIKEIEEDSATRIVNQITLDCLLNKEQYAKYLNSSVKKTMESNKRDRKFYKKRIMQITKDMLASDDIEIPITSDMLFAFDNFTRTCISYFKMMDKTDILQTDYPPPITTTTTNLLDDLSPDNSLLLEESNKSIMRTVKLSPITMDKFVKRISMASNENPPFIPLKREVNLKDPELRNKGIRKKKNVNTLYDANSQEDTSQISPSNTEGGHYNNNNNDQSKENI